MVNFLQQLEIATYEDVSKRLNVPSWVLNGTSETKAAFIAGLMDTDGYVQNKGGGAITSKSWELIQDLSVVCASLGWKYSLKADLNKEYCRHYYTISISRFYLHNLLPYMRCSWKIAALTSAKPRTEKQYETVWAANVVKQVLPLGKRKLVDIEVDSSQHLYTANTFVTHNTCNFLLIFDGGPRRLNEEMPEFSLETCKGFKLSYFERYPDYHNFLKKTLALGKKKLAAVSENGRVRRLPDLALGEFINWERRRFMGPPEMIARLSESLANKKKPVTQETLWDEAGLKFSHAKKQLYNFPMQTTGASITKAALSRLFLEGLRVVTTVHDSIVVEVPEESADELAQKIRHIMETAYPLSVPLKVDLKILTSLSEKDVWIPAIKTVKKIA
jgi:hypothetical protein